MNKRVGLESMFGVGGGMVSKSSERNVAIAEDLCRRGRPKEALPYLDKAMQEENLDAFVQTAFLMPTLNDSVRLLETAEKLGRRQVKKALGPTCFDDGDINVGRFWGLLETRPYMRVLQAAVRLNFENKSYKKAVDIMIEMLRLCPGDNLGQRDWLGSVLLKAKRPEDALSFAQNWMAPEAGSGMLERGGCIFKSPFKDPLSPQRAQKLSEWCCANFPYTGALAAFQLWGDCELARQYLRIATKLNPHVLLKILAKVEQPHSLNMSARSFNGPEEAHDYLWLTQDLWMVPEVWNWANGVTDAKELLYKECSRDGCANKEKTVAEFKRCGACHEVWYCGPECQKSDWKTHKPACQKHKYNKQLIRAMTTGRPMKGKDTSGSGYAAAASADFSERGNVTKFM